MSLEIRENIDLPTYLFERILTKSKDLGWYISTDHLKICLKHRDALKWQYIDLSYLYNKDIFGIQELNDIASSKFPLKQLAFVTKTVTPAMMMQISTFASTLEHLDIQMVSEQNFLWLETTENINEIKFPKLKYLRLDFEVVSLSILDMIDISSFSDSIRVLKLINFIEEFSKTNDAMDRFTAKLVTILRSCKNLVTLSLENCNFFFTDEIFDSIRSLKSLRKLNLVGVNFAYSLENKILIKESLAKFVMDLPNLKSLEINIESMEWEDFECLQHVNLHYFGFYECEDPTTISSINAKQIGMNFGLYEISYLLYYDGVPGNAINAIYYDLNEIINPDDRQTWDRLERGLLKCLELRPYCINLFSDIAELIRKGGSGFHKKFLQKVGRIIHSIVGASKERFYDWTWPFMNSIS